MRDCLHVVCDDLRVYLCNVSSYSFLCCVWWCVPVSCIVVVVEDCLLCQWDKRAP